MLQTIHYTIVYWFHLLVVQGFCFFLQRKKFPVETLGNRGAQWKIPLSLLSQQSVCYCAGVGEDISFELELSKIIHPQIFLFDPTPRAIRYIKGIPLSRKIHFSPWGLWATNSKQKFYQPQSQAYVSHSIVNLHGTHEYFIAECKSLDWIMKQNRHPELSLLKLDIEGAEYAVLEKLLRTKNRPKILAVEFDQPTPLFQTISMIVRLIKSGYILVDQTRWNFIFVYDF